MIVKTFEIKKKELNNFKFFLIYGNNSGLIDEIIENDLKPKLSKNIYNYDENGISSKYKKFSKFWWKKRNEAFEYMISLMKKFNTKSRLGPDYYLTKIINLFV